MVGVSVILATILAAGVPGALPQIKSGEQLIQAMRAKYPNWYRKLSFVQRAIYPDGRPEEEWWEAVMAPGRLRIDVAPVDSGRTVIYRGDSNFVFQKGQLARAVKGRNILAILAFDVYLQPAGVTAALIREEGFELDKFREDTWKGAATYVIGAAGKELWIEKKRLILLRVLQTVAPNGPATDISFDRFKALGGGWLGTEVLFLRDGKESFREIYRDWRINNAVTDDLFRTDVWRRAAWIPKS
jgi:hypothetical protein